MSSENGFLWKTNIKKLNKMFKTNTESEDEMNYKKLIDVAISASKDAHKIPLNFA